MIDKGANPYIVDYNGNTQYKLEGLDHLPNMPKSVFFTTRPLVGNNRSKVDFLDPWFYHNGVFNINLGTVCGRGTSGTVITGEWYGKKAAYKFVEIGTQKFEKDVPDAIKNLDEKLAEMTSIQATKGSKIVQFYGHYR